MNENPQFRKTGNGERTIFININKQIGKIAEPGA